MMRGFSVILMMLAALLLAGCRFIPSKDNFTIKSIITATYDGKPIEGSAVLYQRYDYKPTNYTRGEATVLHLGDNKRAYLLTVDRNFRHFYFFAMKNAFGNEKWDNHNGYPKGTNDRVRATPAGTLLRYKYEQWANRAGSRYYGHPLLVAFEDESDPTSVFLVETEAPTTLFGKPFTFQGFYLQRMANNTPLTKEIENFLPWANRNHPYWTGKAFSYLETSPRGTPLSNNVKNRVSRRYFSTID